MRRKAKAAVEKIAIALDPSTSATDLRKLSALQNEAIRRAVAQNVSAPADVLIDALLHFPVEVSENPSFAFFCMEIGDSMEWVPKFIRVMLAEKEGTPIVILSHLAFDHVHQIRASLADGKKTPQEVLQILSGDADSDIRSRVANNPRTDASILDALARDEADSVRYGVATNSNSSKIATMLLATDANEEIMKMARNRLVHWFGVRDGERA